MIIGSGSSRLISLMYGSLSHQMTGLRLLTVTNNRSGCATFRSMVATVATVRECVATTDLIASKMLEVAKWSQRSRYQSSQSHNWCQQSNDCCYQSHKQSQVSAMIAEWSSLGRNLVAIPNKNYTEIVRPVQLVHLILGESRSSNPWATAFDQRWHNHFGDRATAATV